MASFHGRDGAIRFLKLTSVTIAELQPWSYWRLSAYSFLGFSEGAYGGDRDSGACGLTAPIDTFPRTRASQEPDWPTAGVIPGEWNGLSARDAQAACCFKCLASKLTPFFQTIKVIAAILRAKVRRAIEGFLPLASKAW